jgi:hypothetical protein
MTGASVTEEAMMSAIGTPVQDRRRAGWMEHRNPNLVALLRDASNPAIEPDDLDDTIGAETGDALRAARGIALGVVISGLAWILISSSIWMLFVLRG